MPGLKMIPKVFLLEAEYFDLMWYLQKVEKPERER